MNLLNYFFRCKQEPLKNKRVLFICNKQKMPDYSYQKMFSGLYNSARMISEMLAHETNIVSKVVRVIDSNSIDREVSQFKPDIVFIEALWVPTYKFIELINLHPKVRWVVRIHSEVPFLANEGNALKLIKEYSLLPNVQMACNSPRAQMDLALSGPYLPNYYDVTDSDWEDVCSYPVLNVGCFGAIRPMKNQLLQAIVAMRFANSMGMILHFHMNTSRLEQGGERVLKNLNSLFENTQHKLIEHPWMEPASFKRLLKKMDLGMQVSLSETFNIVAADMVDCGIPVIVSPEISWASRESQADPNSGIDIFNTMFHVWVNRYRLTMKNFRRLKAFAAKSKKTWLKFVNSI